MIIVQHRYGHVADLRIKIQRVDEDDDAVVVVILFLCIFRPQNSGKSLNHDPNN